MANDLTSLSYKILAKAMTTLQLACAAPRLVNSDFSAEAAKLGDRINIPIPSAIGVTDVIPSALDDTPVDTVGKNATIVMDKWKKTNPIYITDKQALELDVKGTFLPMEMVEGVKALANYVNSSIYSKYISDDGATAIFSVSGNAGTTPFTSGVTDATTARAVMNRALIPRTDRRGIINYDAEANMLALAQFSDVEKVGEKGPKIDGEIGRKYGVDWYSDDALITHVAGTITTGAGAAARTAAVNNVGGYAAGTNIINIDNGAGATVTGTLKVGDVFSFTGNNNSFAVVANASSPQYDVPSKTYTFASNAIIGLKFYPPLPSAIPGVSLAQTLADNLVLTVKATHVVNLLFHRDAFGFANRPLSQARVFNDLGGSKISSITDPVTGLTMRLEVKNQNKQVAMELDMLWGVDLIRPELAVRLMG